MSYDFNYFAILTAALLNMIIGGIWYSPKVFGAAWMELTGMTEEKAQKGAGKAMGVAAVVSVVSAFVLAAVIAWVSGAAGGAELSFVNGAMIGFWIWAGFTGLPMFSSAMFEQQPVKLAGIHAGYYLVTFVIQGGLIAAWVN